MLQVKRHFFLQSNFEYFCLTSFFLLVFTSHSASNSQVSEVSKIVPTFFMMLEARWTAAEIMLYSFVSGAS